MYEIFCPPDIRQLNKCHVHFQLLALDQDEVKRLRAAMMGIIKKAVSVDADSDRFPKGWLFHVRWGKSVDAETTGGEKVQFDEVGGRTTAWVPSLQR